MFDVEIVLYCAFALFAGGAVKGVAGIGLPLIAVPLLSFAVNLPTAISLLLLPVIASNLFQAFQGGVFLPTLRRFWPLIAVYVPTAVVGAKLLVSIDERILYVVMGMAILALTILLRVAAGISIGPRLERVLAPIVGAVAGVLGGMSSFFGPPLMLFLLGLRLPKQEFVRTISLLYFIGSVVLALALAAVGVVRLPELGASALAMLPVFAGLHLGQYVQARLDNRRFDTVVTVVFLLTATSFLYRGFN
ncbi:MAG: sulfite exporter TauE/SafE family protein [Rhodospirillales bacterium]|nr:sulfite exporter TauE/SafE family protein [Rhodospirillales bacterium]